MRFPIVNLQKSVLRRIFHEVVLAAVLIGLVASELPLQIQSVSQSSPAPVRSCCASSLKTTSLAGCGCSAKKRNSGTCCCRGTAAKNKSSRESETPSFQSCPCSPVESRWLSFSQPRVPIAPSVLTLTVSESPYVCGILHSPGTGSPEPECPPPKCS